MHWVGAHDAECLPKTAPGGGRDLNRSSAMSFYLASVASRKVDETARTTCRPDVWHKVANCTVDRDLDGAACARLRRLGVRGLPVARRPRAEARGGAEMAQ